MTLERMPVAKKAAFFVVIPDQAKCLREYVSGQESGNAVMALDWAHKKSHARKQAFGRGWYMHGW